MEANKETPPPIIDQLMDYAETRVKLAKYQAIEGGTSFTASVIADVVVIISMGMAFVFASITLGFYLGEVFKSDWEGFLCVSALYLFIAIMMKVFRKHIERPIINTLIQKILK